MNAIDLLITLGFIVLCVVVLLWLLTKLTILDVRAQQIAQAVIVVIGMILVLQLFIGGGAVWTGIHIFAPRPR